MKISLLVVIYSLLSISLGKHDPCYSGYQSHLRDIYTCFGKYNDVQKALATPSLQIFQPNTGIQSHPGFTLPVVKVGQWKVAQYYNNFAYPCDGSIKLSCNSYTKQLADQMWPVGYQCRDSSFYNSNTVYCLCTINYAKYCNIKEIKVTQTTTHPAVTITNPNNDYKTFSMKIDTSKVGAKHVVTVNVVMTGQEKWQQVNEILVCGGQKFKCLKPTCTINDVSVPTYTGDKLTTKTLLTKDSTLELVVDLTNSHIKCLPEKFQTGPFEDEAGTKPLGAIAGLTFNMIDNTLKMDTNKYNSNTVYYMKYDLNNNVQGVQKFQIKKCTIDGFRLDASKSQYIVFASGDDYSKGFVDTNEFFMVSQPNQCQGTITKKLMSVSKSTDVAYTGTNYVVEDGKVTVKTYAYQTFYFRTQAKIGALTLEQTKPVYFLNPCNFTAMIPKQNQPYFVKVPTSNPTYTLTYDSMSGTLYNNSLTSKSYYHCYTKDELLKDDKITAYTDKDIYISHRNPPEITVDITKPFSKTVVLKRTVVFQPTKIFNTLITFQNCATKLETVNSVIQEFNYKLEQNKIHTIDTSTTSAWFKGSDLPDCAINITEIYTDKSMSSIWSDSKNQIVHDKTGTKDKNNNYPIKVNVTEIIAKTLYLGVTAKSGEKAVQAFSIFACNSSILKPPKLQPKQYQTIVPQWTGKESQDITIKYSQMYDLFYVQKGQNCPITKFLQFEDEKATIPWVQDENFIFDKSKTDMSFVPITFNKSKIFYKTFYVKAENEFGDSLVGSYQVAVCGAYTQKKSVILKVVLNFDMDPQWQPYKFHSLALDDPNFEDCPRSQQILQNSKLHDDSLVKFDPKDSKIILINTKKKYTPKKDEFKILTYSRIFIMKRLELQFSWILCEDQKVVVANSVNNTIQNYTNVKGDSERRVKIDQWFSSSIPECPISSYKLLRSDGTPYPGNLVSYDKKQQEIVFSITQNIHLNLEIEATTGKSTGKVKFQIDVCGFEKITNTQKKDINMTLDIDEKDGTYQIIEGKKIFSSSDTKCPITKYELEISEDGKKFTKYLDKVFTADKDGVLKVNTSEEFEEQIIYLTSSTQQGIISRQKVIIKICKLDDKEADQKDRKCYVPVIVKEKKNYKPYLEFNSDRIKDGNPEEKVTIELPDLYESYKKDPTLDELVLKYELGKAKDKDKDDIKELEVKLISPAGLEKAIKLQKDDTDIEDIYKYSAKVNMSEIYKSSLNLEEELLLSFAIVINDQKNATKIQFPMLVPKKPEEKKQEEKEPEPEPEPEPVPVVVIDPTPVQEIKVVEEEKPQEKPQEVKKEGPKLVVKQVSIAQFNIPSDRPEPKNEPVKEAPKDVPITEIVAPQIASIITAANGECTISFSKQMMFPANWVTKFQSDSGGNVDTSMVDKISVPFVNFWFEQAVAEGDALQEEIPESNVKITRMTPTQVVFKIDFNFLENPEAISLTLATEQDKLVIDIPKTLIINDQDGNSIVLNKDQFQAETGSAYQIIVNIEPQQFTPKDETEKRIVNSAMSVSTVTSASQGIGLANALFTGAPPDDLADSMNDEQISASNSALKVVQSGHVNGYNAEMAKTAAVDYKAVDFLSQRNMTWTSQPPEGEGLKRLGVTSKNFPKNIGSSVFVGGGATAAGAAATPALQAASQIMMEGGEISNHEQVKILKRRYHAMYKSSDPILNVILAIVYMKLIIASVVNTQNSDLLVSSNFGPNGSLSGGDQTAIILGLIGIAGSFIIYIMLTLSIVTDIPWMFNFGKKIKGTENILRRKENHRWFLFTITQMKTFIWVFIIIFLSSEQMACPQLFLSLIVNPVNIYIGWKLEPLPKIGWFDLNWVGKGIGVFTLIATYFTIGQTDVNRNLSPNFKLLIGFILLASGQSKFYLNMIKTFGRQYYVHQTRIERYKNTCCKCFRNKNMQEIKFTDEKQRALFERLSLIDRYQLKYKQQFYKLEKLDFHPSNFNKVAPIEAFRPYPKRVKEQKVKSVVEIRRKNKRKYQDKFKPGKLTAEEESSSDASDEIKQSLSRIEEQANDHSSHPESVFDQNQVPEEMIVMPSMAASQFQRSIR